MDRIFHLICLQHLQFNAGDGLFGDGLFVEGEHWKKHKLVGHGRAGSCWIAELMECPFYFVVKEVSMHT